jgi:sRNA-binding regulator protein Hfq
MEAAAEARGRIYVSSDTVTQMANFSNIPVTGLSGFRSATPIKRSPPKLQAVSQSQNPKADAPDSATLPATGPRKLVRPTLPERGLRKRAFPLREESPIMAHQSLNTAAASTESSHAEAFYFQKQIQAQTQMIIVLEDGSQIEGCVEWYDRNSIKVKGSARVLVYKAGIKYIYKAGEKRL